MIDAHLRHIGGDERVTAGEMVFEIYVWGEQTVLSSEAKGRTEEEKAGKEEKGSEREKI